MATRVWCKRSCGLNDHWNHCGARAYQRILVLAILLLNPSHPCGVVEWALALATHLFAAEDDQSVLLLRVAQTRGKCLARAQVRGLQRTRGYRWITHPLSYSRWEGYQWIELNEYIKVTGCPREVTNTVNVGDGVKTLFICNWQVLKQLLLSG